jgi:hypothetical protein
LSEAGIVAAEFVFADAQLVIAWELGFISRPKTKSRVQPLLSPVLSKQVIVISNKYQPGNVYAVSVVE